MTIVNVTKTFGLLTIAALGLSACGGAGSTTQADFVERIERVENLTTRVLGDGEDNEGLGGTEFTAVPIEGTGAFAGFGGVGVDTSTEETSSAIAMIGYAEVDVNFVTGKFDGSVVNIQSISGNFEDLDATPEDFAPSDAEGTIALSGGSIAKNRISDVAYGGTLTVDGTDYVVAGTAAGKFLGTRPAVAADPDLFRIKAMNIEDEEGTVTVGETVYTSSFGLVAESQ